MTQASIKTATVLIAGLLVSLFVSGCSDDSKEVCVDEKIMHSLSKDYVETYGAVVLTVTHTLPFPLETAKEYLKSEDIYNTASLLKEDLAIVELLESRKIDNSKYLCRAKFLVEHSTDPFDMEKVEVEKGISLYFYLSRLLPDGLKSVDKEITLDYEVLRGKNSSPSSKVSADSVSDIFQKSVEHYSVGF